jgi:hypothetical protein
MAINSVISVPLCEMVGAIYIDGEGRGKVKSNIKYKRANIQTKNKIPTTMEGVEIGNEIRVWAGKQRWMKRNDRVRAKS